MGTEIIIKMVLRCLGVKDKEPFGGNACESALGAANPVAGPRHEPQAALGFLTYYVPVHYLSPDPAEND